MHNQITIHGYAGRDPEMTEVQGQNGPYKKTTVSIGVSRDFGDETDWFYCVFYGKRAEVVEKWIRKGSQVIVTGRMESYKPKNDPQRTAWLLRADGFDFCDKKVNSDGSSAVKDVNEAAEGFEDLTDEDIPF